MDNSEIRVIDFSVTTLSSSIKRGDVVAFCVTLDSNVDACVLVDYSIGFMKANGKSKQKVFKWKQMQLAANESVTLTKNHHFKSDATTFVLYPGMHTCTLQINGRQLHPVSFELL